MSMVELSSTERKLAERIDQAVTGELAISDRVGGVAFVSMDQVMEFAKLMAISSIAVPKHLRGNAGACLAICIQSLEWQMSPYSVANKSYSVNDRISYEAQLIEAVILRRAPIKGRPKIEYKGDGESRVCRIWAELRDEPGEIVEYESPIFSRITPKNSPLWKADPDQQHFYFSVRAWCRRHFPDILLGVYARDELGPVVVTEGDVPLAPRSIASALDTFAANGDTVDLETGEITSDPKAAAAVCTRQHVDEVAEHPASPQNSAPAAGPTAPDSPPKDQSGAGAAASEPAAQTKTAKPKVEPKAGAVPTNEAEYIAHAHTWRNALTDADAGEKQWKAEKSLRNKTSVNVSPENRDDLEKALKAKCAELRKG